MPNTIDSTGIHTLTRNEIVTNLTAAFRAIYGDDINLESNSPDGQLLNIFAQTISDVLDLVTQVYTSFDPDQAIGTSLDARCAYNGVKRLGGTFTQVQILVKTDRTLTLTGLDTSVNDPDGTGYTVSDSAGNQFILMSSYTFGAASPSGTLLTFRARTIGAVLTTPDTITIPVTIVLGVTSVNNPNVSISTGLNQETDAALHIRRQKSVAISSQSYLDGLLAALLNIEGVTAAAVYENNTSGTVDTIPAHSIWAIVSGGEDDAIGAAIYAKRSAGCGMKGDVSVDVPRPNGSTFEVLFDRVSQENLYLKFTLDALDGTDIVTTGNMTSGNPVCSSIADTTGMQVGHLIRSVKFPAGTTILSVDSLTQITASANASASGTGSAITVVPIVVSTLKTEIVNALDPDIYETLNINQMSTLIQSINANALVTYPTGNGLSSDGMTYTPTLTPTAFNLQFALTTGRIAIV